MLDFIAANKDLIIAAATITMTADMLPTVYHQFRSRICSIPLTSSIPTAICLAVLGLVFFASGLYIATGTVTLGALVWGLVSGQRLRYNKSEESAIENKAYSPDPELQSKYRRLHSPSSDNTKNSWG